MAITPDNQQSNDRRLIARVADGDDAAFRELYDRLANPLYSLALKMLGDAAEAQDALQDISVQIWRRASNYDPAQSSVFSWAVIITRSKVIDRLRARGRRLRVVVPEIDNPQDAEQIANASTTRTAADTAGKKDDANKVRAMLNQLPSEQRQAIELAFFGDLTHHEIAARLAQPLGTVKARIRRGLLRLRDALKNTL